MADINESAPISATGSAADRQRQNEERNRRLRETPKRPPMRETVSDVTFIMGIPAGEVTPKVQEAVFIIMNELDHLRGQVNYAHDRVAYLEKLSEEHSFLPVMNARGFMKELTRIITHSARMETVSSLLCFHFTNIEDIRRAHGYAAVKAALTHAAEVISGNLRDTDIIGSLEGDDIWVILTVVNGGEALNKARELTRAVEESGVIRGNDTVRLKAVCGVHVLTAADTGETAVDAADRDVRASLRR